MNDVLQAADKVGGWVFAAVSLAITGWYLLRAFARGDIVPGALLQRALKQNDDTVATLGRMTNSLEDVVRQTGVTSTTVERMREEVTRLGDASRVQRG